MPPATIRPGVAPRAVPATAAGTRVLAKKSSRYNKFRVPALTFGLRRVANRHAAAARHSVDAGRFSAFARRTRANCPSPEQSGTNAHGNADSTRDLGPRRRDERRRRSSSSSPPRSARCSSGTTSISTRRWRRSSPSLFFPPGQRYRRTVVGLRDLRCRLPGASRSARSFSAASAISSAANTPSSSPSW